MLTDLITQIRLPFLRDRGLYRSLHHILGFYPRNIRPYKVALLHRSASKKVQIEGKRLNNERLEFLGDAILGAVVGHIVYRHFPKKPEGFLTNTRSNIVKRQSLNKLAKDMGLDRLIVSDLKSQAHNSYVNGNAFEALVGAIYLDRGYDACMRFMEKRILSQLINLDKVAYKEVNFKSKLLEWCQKNRVALEFRDLNQTKDAQTGSPVFTTEVFIEGIEGCKGTGFSKKESQQQASKETLQRLRREPQFIDAVFAAKADRTKMEEEPVMAVPNLEKEQQNFIIEHSNAKSEASVPTDGKEQEVKGDDTGQEEFDLSDISHKEKSREDIIAEAEAAAFAEA